MFLHSPKTVCFHGWFFWGASKKENQVFRSQACPDKGCGLLETSEALRPSLGVQKDFSLRHLFLRLPHVYLKLGFTFQEGLVKHSHRKKITRSLQRPRWLMGQKYSRGARTPKIPGTEKTQRWLEEQIDPTATRGPRWGWHLFFPNCHRKGGPFSKHPCWCPEFLASGHGGKHQNN